MNDLRAYLDGKLRDIISTWDEEDIYAISFFVNTNEVFEYNGCSNVPVFNVSYNTEADCHGAGERAEKRWNYAFWRHNETPVIDADEDDEGMKILFRFYGENGIENIGYEDYSACYDSKMRYIGKGPIGCYELISEITAVAKGLQESGFIKNQFGKSVPILIHDYEYAWYTVEATKAANPNGEADVFLAALKELGISG